MSWYGWRFWDQVARFLAIEQAAYTTRADRQVRAWRQLLTECGARSQAECMQQDAEDLVAVQP